MSQSKSQAPASRKNYLPASLSDNLERNLLGYAAAASAAGISILALAQASHAEIVYTETHQTIVGNGSFVLDLNNDGITDFTIDASRGSCFSGPNCFLQKLIVNHANNLNRVGGFRSFAFALRAGSVVGPKNTFTNYSYGRMERCKATQESASYSGNWDGTYQRYLGLEFQINGKTHYGWARIASMVLAGRCNYRDVLSGYAYETVPGRPIIAGKTSGPEERGAAINPGPSLGMLALGSGGLVAWRRDEPNDEPPPLLP
jgi:hypothetical protein